MPYAYACSGLSGPVFSFGLLMLELFFVAPFDSAKLDET